ncbi:MAG: hypothetical protein N3E37_02355 [Candidatus Micrarchaeota archaeon]|nr:hypothetical protein [Candidatus Micrarchaeota archaeon]
MIKPVFKKTVNYNQKSNSNYTKPKPLVESPQAFYVYWKELHDTSITPLNEVKKKLYALLNSLNKDVLLEYLTRQFKIEATFESQLTSKTITHLDMYNFNCTGYSFFLLAPPYKSPNAKKVFINLIKFFENDTKSLYHLLSKMILVYTTGYIDYAHNKPLIANIGDLVFTAGKLLPSDFAMFKNVCEVLKTDSELLLKLLTEKPYRDLGNQSSCSAIYNLFVFYLYGGSNTLFVKMNRELAQIFHNDLEAKYRLFFCDRKAIKKYFTSPKSLKLLRIYFNQEELNLAIKRFITLSSMMKGYTKKEIFDGCLNVFSALKIKNNYDIFLVEYFRYHLNNERFAELLFLGKILYLKSIVNTRNMLKYYNSLIKVMITADRNKFLDAITTFSRSGRIAKTWEETFIGMIIKDIYILPYPDNPSTKILNKIVFLLRKEKLLLELIQRKDAQGTSLYQFIDKLRNERVLYDDYFMNITGIRLLHKAGEKFDSIYQSDKHA